MNRTAFLATFLFVLTACGQSETATSTASPARPTAASSAIRCRLPVLVPRSGGTVPLGGLVNLPGGEFARDPESLPEIMNHAPGYDWPLRRWLPVESVNVSPDGSLYVLDQLPGTPIGAIYLVNVATGTRRMIFSSPDYRRVVAYRKEGIYLTDNGIEPDPGLWLLDPDAGTARRLPGSQRNSGWKVLGARSAWSLSGNSSQTVLRLDLVSGQVASWYQSSLPLDLAAVDDQDFPVVKVLGDPVAMGRLTGPNQLQEFHLPAGMGFSGDAYAAGSQIWLPLQRDEGLAVFTGDPVVQVLKT